MTQSSKTKRNKTFSITSQRPIASHVKVTKDLKFHWLLLPCRPNSIQLPDEKSIMSVGKNESKLRNMFKSKYMVAALHPAALKSWPILAIASGSLSHVGDFCISTSLIPVHGTIWSAAKGCTTYSYDTLYI